MLNFSGKNTIYNNFLQQKKRHPKMRAIKSPLPKCAVAGSVVLFTDRMVTNCLLFDYLGIIAKFTHLCKYFTVELIIQ